MSTTMEIQIKTAKEVFSASVKAAQRAVMRVQLHLAKRHAAQVKAALEQWPARVEANKAAAVADRDRMVTEANKKYHSRMVTIERRSDIESLEMQHELEDADGDVRRLKRKLGELG